MHGQTNPIRVASCIQMDSKLYYSKRVSTEIAENNETKRLSATQRSSHKSERKTMEAEIKGDCTKIEISFA